MSKLFNLKKWLTLPEAARHLSIVFGEDVTEADVLRLALDDRLWLSVHFVNHAKARRGKAVPLSEAKRVPGIPLKNGAPCEPYEVILGLRIFVENRDGQVEEKVVQFDEKIVSIDGVWDLTMFGGERIDIEYRYQMLTSGVEVTLVNIDGTYLRGPEGEIWELQGSFDDSEYAAGSSAQLEKLKQHIADNNIGAAKAKILLDQHKEERKKFLEKAKEKRDAGKNSENYYPVGRLPTDSVLVVRTDALREFEQSINNASKGDDKPLGKRAEATYQNIIAALLECIAGNLPGVDRHPSFESEAKLIEAIDQHFQGYGGLSKSNLSRKFPEAKRTIASK